MNEERFFNTLIGYHVRESLFELPDNQVRATLKAQIENSILNFEPRVNLTDVIINHPNDTNDLEVTVVYDIIGQEATPQEITFILQPTRVYWHSHNIRISILKKLRFLCVNICVPTLI